MKKLLFILSAILVSGITYGANNYSQANPFAYDLSYELRNNGNTLALSYTLNADAVTSSTYNNSTSLGVKINLIDEQQNSYTIRHITDPNSTCVKKGRRTVEIQISEIPIAFKDRPITWEIEVFGNKNRTQPKLVYTNIKTDNSVFYPRAAHGIAVGKNPDKPNFAKLFTAEASTNTLSGKSVPNSLWEFNMQMKYQKYHHKDILDGGTSHFSAATNTEPHRVKISDDGRIFATCYHETAISAVLEYVGNGNWKTVVIADVERNSYQDEVLYAKDDKYNRRPIAMDVKGSGDNLKIIVAWMKPKGKKINNNGKNDRMHAQIQVIEYEVGSDNYNIDQDNGTVVAEYIDHDTEGNRGGTYDGMLFQSYYYGYNQALHGFIGVAYGDDNSIWLKVDFGFGISNGRRSHILRYDQGSKEAKYTYTFPSADKYRHTTGGYYGGAGLLIKGNQLITGSGSNSLLIYTIKGDKTLDETDSNVKSYASGTPGTSTWLDAITEDYAGNLYCISEAADNIVIFAMPYDGTRKTRANTTFTVSDPVPNILATDLRYEVNNANEYIFSFNTNTQPEYAELRFYSSYDAMKNSLNVVNADNYNGTNANKPVCFYRIPSDRLKQGRVEVTLGGVGGTIDANGEITNSRIPAGELYWSVYVKTRESKVFAPIYQYGATTDATNGHHRKHIAVNNYPETDMFGSLIVAHNPSVTDDATRANRGLHIYGINPDGNSDDEQGNINNTRYSKRAEYLNQNADGRLHYPRRLVVGHDGKVYVADEGTETASRTTQGGVIHEHGGVKLWDPTNPNKFALFSDNKIGTATGVALYKHADGWKLYANNTYNEFSSHGNAYTKENQDNPVSYGWNGFVGYVLDKYTSAHNGSWSSWGNNATEVALRRGDASGNFAFAAMDKGIWICQYREHTVALKTAIQQPLADNFEAYVLSFVPYGTDIRTWKSSESIGVKSYSNGTPVWDDIISPYSQTTTAPLQSTPGGGIAYKKINEKEYVYVVNHDGNIAVLEITGWTGTGVSATPIIPVNNIKILTTPEFTKVDREVSGTSTKWHTAYITSMCFDYAGNLITTTGKGYHDAPQDIVVYTMPYDRVNAREIQAPNSCRMIPERLAYLDMSAQELELVINNHTDHDGCAIELFRPLQAGMFNTICLPFELDFANLPDEHPFKDAEVKAFTGVVLEDVGGEKVLSLVFSDITQGSQKIMSANVPYLLEPMEDIVGSVRFDNPVRLTSIEGNVVGFDFDGNHIDFKGVVPITPLEATYADGTPLKLLLVADNRLAALTSNANILGFRAYFQLAKPLPAGTSAKIVGKKPVTTNTTIIVDGKKVNVEKFLREGRVYIRVGETLYNVMGDKVMR